MLRTAALLGLFGVGLGAFGAHGLRARVSPEMLDIYKTGVLYHLVHAVAALALALGAAKVRHVRWVFALFVAGIVIFSGSLYLLAATGLRGLGAITPIGGVAFLAGWLTLAVGARSSYTKESGNPKGEST